MSLLLLLVGAGEGTPEPEPEIIPPVGGRRWLPEPVRRLSDDNEWLEWWD